MKNNDRLVQEQSDEIRKHIVGDDHHGDGDDDHDGGADDNEDDDVSNF